MQRAVNIAFAGLTAAGKTTHSKLLAEQLGYKYVSGTDILLDILQLDQGAENLWFRSSPEALRVGSGDEVDEELERRLLEMAAGEQGVVFDTWALAWICHTPLIRIWIESDVASRTRKCFISQKAQLRDLDECRLLIDRKDEWTRANFIRRLGFDLFTDRGRYDRIIDNSSLIPFPSLECAQDGIRLFDPVVLRAVAEVCRERGYTTSV